MTYEMASKFHLFAVHLRTYRFAFENELICVSIRSHKVIVEQNLMNARSKACKERPVWQYHFWSQLVDMSSFRAQCDHFERRGESVERVAKAWLTFGF